MPWKELQITVGKDTVEALSEHLTELGAVAVTTTSASQDEILEPLPETTPLWNQTSVVGLFEADANLESITQELGAQLPSNCVMKKSILEDQDWERTCLEDFKPMQFGKSLWICPSWLKPPKPEDTIILLDPGLAFGTGTHQTTSLCLEWLDANPPQELNVLDYGCGSGILSLAALKLGAKHLTAVDYDPQALEATLDNCSKNNINSERINVYSPKEQLTQTYDLILANILAQPLIDLAPLLSSLLKPGGKIILSGLLDSQADIVMEAYKESVKFDAPTLKDEWVRLDGCRC